MRKKAKAKGKSGFWGGLLVGAAIAGTALYFVPPMLRNQDDGVKTTKVPQSPPSKKAVQKPETVPQSNPPPAASPAGGIRLFRRPDLAAGLPVRFGMKESYPGSFSWKKTDLLGWNSFASLTIPAGNSSKSGDVDNTITCLFESKSRDRVEVLRLVANIFNGRGEAPTIAQFKSLAQAFLAETGCLVTRQFVEAIGGTEGLQTETPEGYFELKKMGLNTGSRWELTVKSK